MDDTTLAGSAAAPRPLVEQPGLTGWYRELGKREKKTFWACFGGWSLDSMDVNLYSFVIPTLIGLWGMTRGDAGLLATAALLSSALGGWITGIVADRIGRVRALQITILWFADLQRRRQHRQPRPRADREARGDRELPEGDPVGVPRSV